VSNQFATTPTLDTAFPKVTDLWTCPVTGMVVPKDPDANLQWRASILEQAENDTDLQQDLYTACSQSLLFFVNAFAFTLRVFESGEEGVTVQSKNKHLPFVTWEIQDQHLLRIENAIDNGESMLTDKSRDMGATWDHLIVYVHRFLFRADESHLMLSRKEEVVDGLSGLPKNYPFGPLADPGTLFGKIDYVLSRLPEWMLARMVRKNMHLINLDNRTRIDGESSNATAGSSDRRTSIFMDEMAKMKEAEAVKRSTKDVTACRLVCSTPNGAGTAFSKWRLSGQIPVFVLPWWEHPEKGMGRYVKEDELGRFRIRSPWYDKRCAEDSPKEIAIELDMDHVGSGDLFFEGNIIEQHRKLFARKPLKRLAITWKKAASEEAICEAIRRRETKLLHFTHVGGPWQLWVKLINGRLDQTKTYTLACDLSKGQGASNSVIAVMCNETREKVAEYADANTPPYEVAKLACAAALWVGGRNKRPLIIWENNGDPGFDFGRQLVHVYRYPIIYFDRVAGTLGEKKGKRYGWRSSPEKKASALGRLRRAYAHGKFINHSEAALAEALTYIHYEGGGIGPAELLHESDSTRKAHGDRVIADMLCITAVDEAPGRKIGETVAPNRSFAARFKAFKQRNEDKKKRDKFNFAE
jgi:hypothetical protein